MNARYELRVVELLTEIRDDQRRVLRLLEEERRPAPVDERAGKLLAVIAEHVGDRVFSSAELVTHARLAPALRFAIVESFGALNARRIGKWLRRVEGQVLGGLRVERIGADALGVAWRVCRVSDSETHVAQAGARCLA
jgi:hypothetical protein